MGQLHTAHLSNLLETGSSWSNSTCLMRTLRIKRAPAAVCPAQCSAQSGRHLSGALCHSVSPACWAAWPVQGRAGRSPGTLPAIVQTKPRVHTELLNTDPEAAHQNRLGSLNNCHCWGPIQANQTKIGVDLSELLKQPRWLYTQPERSVRPHPLFNPQSTSSSQSQPGQRGVQPIHGNPHSVKTRSRSKLFKVKNLGANRKEPRGSEEEGMNITLLINKYLLFTRHKVRKVSVGRRKLTRWDQVMVGDSELSLNTRSEAKAIQAHHHFWLFPPNSHRTWKSGWEVKPPSRTGGVPPSTRHQPHSLRLLVPPS